MAEIGADTDLFTRGVVAMAGNQRLHLIAIAKAQGIQHVGPADVAPDHLGLDRAGVVVDDAFGPHQNIHLLSIEQDPPGLQRFEPGDGARHGGFAAAAFAKQAADLPPAQAQGEISDHPMGPG